MVSNGNSKISVDADEALSVLGKLKAAHDSPGIPSGSDFDVHLPARYPAISSFNDEMTGYGIYLSHAVDNLRLKLSAMHDEIQRTLDEFAARDAEVAMTAAAIMGSIDSGSTVPVSNAPAPNTSAY